MEALESNTSQRIMLHGGAGKSSIGHLRFWIPIFESANIDFVILTRDMVVYDSLCEAFPLCSVVYAKTPLDVEEVLHKLSSLKALFYTSNAGKNIHLLRFNHLKHIYIGSKNSDYLSKITKFYRAYDEILISGEGMMQKFKREKIKLGHLTFVRVGKPHLKHLFEQKRVSHEAFKLTYLPTWEGKNESLNLSSLPLLSAFLYTIQSFNLSLSVKLHPKTAKRDKSLSSLSEKIEEVARSLTLEVNQHNDKDKTTEADNFIWNSDAIICDLETLSLEYLAMDIPIFLYIPMSKNIEAFLDRGYEKYTYTFSSIEELSQKLQGIIAGKDELKSFRKEAMEYWLGREETLAEKFIDHLKHYC